MVECPNLTTYTGSKLVSKLSLHKISLLTHKLHILVIRLFLPIHDPEQVFVYWTTTWSYCLPPPSKLVNESVQKSNYLPMNYIIYLRIVSNA